MRKRLLYSRMVFAAIAAVFAASQVVLNAQQSAEAVRAGKDAIGGVVSSTNGPEAGVWVIAETTDLPTKTEEERRNHGQPESERENNCIRASVETSSTGIGRKECHERSGRPERDSKPQCGAK